MPFLDLTATSDAVRSGVAADLDALLSTGAYTNGPAVAAFEQNFANYCKSRHCVGVSSGLDALRLILISLGIGEGDEVIVPAHTFIATFEAVSQCGATPVPVDVSAEDWTIRTDLVRLAVTPRTRAILAVHLFGQMADVNSLAEIADAAGVALIEDAAQAHGAERQQLRAGSVGIAAGFSFYPGKNLGAIGDAGAVTTSDQGLAEAVAALRDHGQVSKHDHRVVGYTARLDTIHAAVLNRKLLLLDEWNEERREIAGMYRTAFAEGAGVTSLPVPEGSSPVWHLFPVQTPHRAALELYLESCGIGFGRHYPIPPHLSVAYRHLGLSDGAFPLAELLADTTLSLPIYPGMTDAQIDRVTTTILDFHAQRAI